MSGYHRQRNGPNKRYSQPYRKPYGTPGNNYNTNGYNSASYSHYNNHSHSYHPVNNSNLRYNNSTTPTANRYSGNLPSAPAPTSRYGNSDPNKRSADNFSSSHQLPKVADNTKLANGTRPDTEPNRFPTSPAACQVVLKYNKEYFRSKYHYVDPNLDRLIHSDEMKNWNLKGNFPPDGYILDTDTNKLIPRTSNIPGIDPRSNKLYAQKHTTGKLTIIERISYDKYSVGPPPNCEIIVYPKKMEITVKNGDSTTNSIRSNNHSNNITIPDISIKNYFKKFADIAHFESFIDPNNALPLHIYLIKFQSSNGKINDSAKAAYMAVKRHRNKECNIMGCQFVVEPKKSSEQLTRIKQQYIKDNELKMTQKKNDEPSKNEIKKVYPIPRNIDYKRLARFNSRNRKIPDDLVDVVENRAVLFVVKMFMSMHGITIEDFRYKLRNYRYARFIDHINGLYIIFNDPYEAIKCVQNESGRMTMMSRTKHFVTDIKFTLILPVITQSRFAGFESSSQTIDKKNNSDKRIVDKSSTIKGSAQGQTYKSSNELVEAAVTLILNDLEQAINNDIKRRLIGPTVFDTLNPTNFPELVAKRELENKKKHEAEQIVEEHNVNDLNNDSFKTKIKEQDLDVFKLYGGYLKPKNEKKRNNVDSSYEASKRRKLELKPMAHLLNEDSGSKEQTPLTDMNMSPSHERSEEEELSSSNEELETDHIDQLINEEIKEEYTEPTTPEITSENKLHMEDEEMYHEKEKLKTLGEGNDIKQQENETIEEKPLQEEEILQEEEVKEEEKEEELEIKIEPEPVDLSIYKPTASDYPLPVFEDDIFGRTSINVHDLQDTIKDMEDLKLLQKVLHIDAQPASTDAIKPTDDQKNGFLKMENVAYTLWKIKKHEVNLRNIKDTQFKLNEGVELDPFIQWKEGSFKAQGFIKIPDRLKSCYLPHRRRLHQPLNTVSHHTGQGSHHNDTREDTPVYSLPKDESNVSEINSSNNNNNSNSNNNESILATEVLSSRDNRAMNRRFQQDIDAQRAATGTESDLLSLNQLNKRRKPVTFARSPIHNWGLYALEPIAAKEMIIEYVGERIRRPVAEMREIKYLKSGIGSSYLFRVDENNVIDATKKGGIARFINHCCEPSCTAKIIKVGGMRRIVIYAIRDIAKNEELTYDYKFEKEKDDGERLPCYCGASTCKGYLN